MLRDLRAQASLVPGGIDVQWRYVAPGTAHPPFRLVRREGEYPAHLDDGQVVVDFADLYRSAALPVPWARIEHWRMVAVNGPGHGATLLQGSVDLCFAAVAAVPPERVVIGWWDGATMQRTTIDEVSRVELAAAPPVAPYTEVVTLEIFATPGGGPELSAGVVTLFGYAPTPQDLAATPGRMEWAPAGGTAVDVLYHVRLGLTTIGAGARMETRGGGSAALATAVEVATTEDPDAGETEWHFRVEDRALPAGRTYYYRLFSTPALPPDAPATTYAIATGSHGMPDRLFELLPPAHRVADLDTPLIEGRGQLARFLRPFGAALDHVQGLIAALPARHDLTTARVDLLPHLSRMIGWEPDLTAPLATQRQDIEFAAPLFASLGTTRNPLAILNRVTGWRGRVKEFANNVLLTNAPESVPLREIWRITASGGTWGAPAPLTVTTHADGDPTVVDAGGTTWVIWHSDRSGRRELWFQRPGTDPAPRRVMDGAPDDAAGLTCVDESPAALVDGTNVVLFWTSTRGGQEDIWTRTMSPAPSAPTQLTDHQRADRQPAVVQGMGRTWLFWSSDRRGVWDIWLRERSGTTWSAPLRLPRDPAVDRQHDTSPAAVMAPGGELWLLWCRDMGDRREIWYRANAGGVWGPALSLSADLATGQRDEAPCAVVRGGEVLLFFHSNRGGSWQIWSRRHDGTQWGPATRLSAEPNAEMEPTALVSAGGDVHVYWSSQRRAPWYRSRTLDLDDPHMLAEMGTFGDHMHYVYDTGTAPDDWYARGTVGVYVEPETTAPGAIDDAIRRANAFLEPFRPAPVRFVWPLGDVAHEEPIEVGHLLGEDWTDGP